MKNLKQKIATGIVWLGGVGSLAGMVGCESPEGNIGLAALGNMAQVSPYATADDRTLGAGLSTIGQMGHNMNTAKAGRSEVNVNVNYPQNNYERSLLGFFFVCNHFRDLDNNGSCSYPKEYEGIKNKFKKNERIILVSHLLNNNAGNLNIKIYSPQEKEIYNENLLIGASTATKTGDSPNYNLTPWLIKRGGLGNYKADWYLDEKLIGSTEFEITE